MMTHLREDLERRFSIRELGLMVGVLVNFGAVVWFASAINAAVGTLQRSVGELSQKIASIEGGAGDRAVIEYRVQQLEQRINTKERP